MAFSPQEKRGILILSFCLILFLGVVYLLNFFPPKSAVQDDVSLIVQIAGQVENPGVYRVTEGTRVFELIELAGGAKEAAYLENLNLASPLYDGQKVIIPEKREGTASFSLPLPPTLEEGVLKSDDSSKININTASASELQALPGIGEVLARRIVEYRTQNGPFHSPEDLKQVRGIGEKRARDLESYLTF